MQQKLNATLAAALLAATLLAYAQNGPRFVLSWFANPPEEQVQGYVLYMAPASNGVYAPTFTNAGGLSTNWTVPRSNWGNWFRVTAYNIAGESDPSGVIYCPNRPGRVFGERIDRF